MSSRLGGGGALANAIEQHDVEALLELTNLMRDRRLCEIELFRSGGETAALRYFNKSAKLIEIEAAHDDKAPLSFA